VDVPELASGIDIGGGGLLTFLLILLPRVLVLR